ncbi:MAG: WD40 repeat domain-containing protein, partial [Pirellulales bacterium]|nr:WD40 repeat domain-containing protein [Pirellulales bacterium]
MRNPRILTATWLLAALALGLTARGDSIAELKPSQVIQLDGQVLLNQVPVVSSVALDPAGRMLVTAGDDHLVRLWDARAGSMQRQLAGHSDWVRVAAFSPDGQVLATAGDDGIIQLWSVSSTRPYRTLSAHEASVQALAFSPDNHLLAAAGSDNQVRVYDGRRGALVRTLEAPGPDVRALLFSPGGRQ